MRTVMLRDIGTETRLRGSARSPFSSSSSSSSMSSSSFVQMELPRLFSDKLRDLRDASWGRTRLLLAVWSLVSVISPWRCLTSGAPQGQDVSGKEYSLFCISYFKRELNLKRRFLSWNINLRCRLKIWHLHNLEYVHFRLVAKIWPILER